MADLKAVELLRAEEFLEQFGTKGMRWGVRKARKAQEAARSADSHEARSHLARAKSTGVSSLTNNEIKVVNERLNLEKKYAQLTYVQKKSAREKIESVIKGAKKVNDASQKLTNKGLVDHIENITGIKVPRPPTGSPKATSTAKGPSKSKANPFNVQAEFNKAFGTKPKQIEKDDPIVLNWDPKTETYR